MSRRLLMAAGSGGSVVVPTDPPDGGGGGPGPDGFPTTSDPILLALRPTGLRTLSTKTAVPGSVLGTNLVAVADEIDAATESPYGIQGADHSGILFLPPGEYQGGTGLGRWLAVVGTTGDPADVVIHSDTTAADGVTHPYVPVYLEGVTLKGSWNPTLDQSPKYASHIAGSGRTTYANVIFDVTEAHISSAADSTWGCAGTVGMDGSPGTRLTFYGCEFYDVTGEGRLGMNLHGGYASDYPSKIMFIDCTAPKGVGYSAGITGTYPDEVYVIGGDIGGEIAVGGSVNVYTDLPNNVTGAASTTRDHTAWPLPETGDHGLVDIWADYYFPSSLAVSGTTEARATVTDTAPMTPVAGRTYYCPVPVPSAMHFNRYGIHVRTGAGASWGWAARPDTPEFYDSPIPANAVPTELRTTLGTDQTLPNGKVMQAYYYSWIAYPAAAFGGNRMWVAFKIANTTGVTIDGSSMLPGLHDCYYSDNNGATITKATAGTPFPLAHAAQVR